MENRNRLEVTVINTIYEVKDDIDTNIVITADTDIVNDLGFDSLRMINFLMVLEEKLGIIFDFETFDISHLNSVRKLCQFIQTQNQETPA